MHQASRQEPQFLMTLSTICCPYGMCTLITWRILNCIVTCWECRLLDVTRQRSRGQPTVAFRREFEHLLRFVLTPLGEKPPSGLGQQPENGQETLKCPHAAVCRATASHVVPVSQVQREMYVRVPPVGRLAYRIHLCVSRTSV